MNFPSASVVWVLPIAGFKTLFTEAYLPSVRSYERISHQYRGLVRYWATAKINMQRLPCLWTISADSQIFHRVGAEPFCKEMILVTVVSTVTTETVFFNESRNRFQGIDSGSLCNLAGRYPVPIRFLAPEKGYKYVSRLTFIETAIQFINSVVHTYTLWTWQSERWHIGVKTYKHKKTVNLKKLQFLRNKIWHP